MSRARALARGARIAAALALAVACLLLLALAGRRAAAAAPVAMAPAPAPPPHRLISLAPSLTELVFALGAGDELVGVTQYCDYPPAARRLRKVGGVEDGTIDLELVASLRPDLVVAISEGQTRAVEALRRLGLEVAVVPSQTVTDVFQAAARLGALLGRQAQAQRLTANLGERMARVRQAVARLPPDRRPRVFYVLWDRPLMTATRSTLIGRLIELAGGINVFADLPGRYPQVSPEAVLERRPQVVVAPDHHSSVVSQRDLAARLGLPRIERVMILDGDLVSRAGPRIADALELLARSLHPEIFPPPPSPPPPAHLGAGGRR
ncbi:MAG: cobalamin-binding protein [Acidobacteria bacterium]|nr:cobalamin-binding protein [Acidobacteriota bacterium]